MPELVDIFKKLKESILQGKVAPHVVSFNDNYCLLRCSVGESNIKVQTILKKPAALVF